MNIVTALTAIGERSGIGAFMNTLYGWPIIESIHFLALAVLLGTVGLFDLRILGVAKVIPMPALHRLVPLGVGAYLVNVVTGALFLVAKPYLYVFNPSFQLKLVCMIVAGLNVGVFYSFLAGKIRGTGSGANAPFAVKIVASISLAAWIGVIVFGRLITVFKPPFHSCPWC